MKSSSTLRRFRLQILFWILGCLLAVPTDVRAYAVAPPVSLEKLEEEADAIFKATAVATKPAEDAWFKPVHDFVVRETEFKVVSVAKGGELGATVRFRHYDESEKPAGRAFQPQYYHFEAGKTYLVFAKRSEAVGVLRQIWANHRGREDQGVLRCANDQPVTGAKVKDVVWSELVALLGSREAKDVIYGLGQLDAMSGDADSFRTTKDFARVDVLKAVSPLMKSHDGEVARAAIGVIGSKNPYLSDDQAEYWLAAVSGGRLPGIGARDRNLKNSGGAMFAKELMRLADGQGAVETRALAIRALGLVRPEGLAAAVKRWLALPEPAVRASATLLLADLPATEAAKRLVTMVEDPAPEVRRSTAHAIGYQQLPELAGTLGTLLRDRDAEVRLAASQSLRSLPPKHEAVAQVMRENLEHAEFQPLFLLALAKDDPEKYLDPLAKVIVERTEPTNWRGGQVPAFTAFNLLFKYLQSRPVEEVRTGKYDRYLDALERGYVTGSSEPRDIYAFYLQRGMDERAKNYRVAAKKQATFDLDYYFKQVDENPKAYTRE
jgi:hypothetical protein